MLDPMAEAVTEGVSYMDIASISLPPISLALQPLAVALGKVVQAAQVVKGNKEEAKMLSERALDAGGKMREVVSVCKGLPIERSESVTREIERLTTTLKECTQFLGNFAQKGLFYAFQVPLCFSGLSISSYKTLINKSRTSTRFRESSPSVI